MSGAHPDEPSSGDLTIADIVLQSGGSFDHDGSDFDMLLQALQAANLVDAVADPGADLTVFAPTDDAFVGLAQSSVPMSPMVTRRARSVQSSTD